MIIFAQNTGKSIQTSDKGLNPLVVSFESHICSLGWLMNSETKFLVPTLNIVLKEESRIRQRAASHFARLPSSKSHFVVPA